MGDISGEETGNERVKLETVIRRMKEREDVRIWYSQNPDEICGLYWFMCQISQRKIPHGKIYMIRLPEWEYEGDNCIIRKKGCGELSAEEWRKLKEENAPLRAVINGRLMSVTETLYDKYIEQEIIKAPQEFYEAKVIGSVMGKIIL